MPHNAVESREPAQGAPVWKPIRKHALTLALVIVGLAVLASSDVLHRLFVRMVTAGETVIVAHPVWGLSLFVLFSAASAMLAFFSTALITPIAVQTWGEPLSIGLLWIGWMLGGMGAYWLGRILGRPVARALTSNAALDRFENRISTHAPFGLVLLFQLAMPSEVPGYVLGLARYRFAKYVLVLGLVELPFAIGTVYLGSSFLERRTALLLTIGGIGVGFTTWALYALQKRLSA
jgi:uncharacterized membrane protein YdjX (TVP38/TMEM64 family)